MSAAKLPSNECHAMLRMIARLGKGGASVEVDEPGQDCGVVTAMACGWTIVFFIDAGDLDYVDRATDHLGRSGDFDDWDCNPVDGLSHFEVNQWLRILGLPVLA